MGKNVSLILNVVLIVAIVPLYLLHFSSGQTNNASPNGTSEKKSDTKESSSRAASVDSVDLPAGELRVAYVNWDTLMNEYRYVEDMMAELEKEQIRMRKDMEDKMKKLQKEYKELKQESTYMTQSELKKAQQRMQRKQQKLKREQRGLQSKLARKRQKMLKRFFDNVNEFLENYNEEEDLDLILRYQRGGNVLFAERGFEITDQVLKGLNKNYEEEGMKKDLPKVSDTGRSQLPPKQSPLSP